jgi:hypothetical protein
MFQERFKSKRKYVMILSFVVNCAFCVVKDHLVVCEMSFGHFLIILCSLDTIRQRPQSLNIKKGLDFADKTL